MRLTKWPRARATVQGTTAWWKFPLAGLAHSVLMLAAFPPIGLWPVSMLAILPLVWAGCHAVRKRWWCGVLTATGAIPFWIISHWWMLDVTLPGYPPLVVYLAGYTAAAVWLIALARSVDWPIPMCVVAGVVWTAFEILRADVAFTGYGLFLLGHPLVHNGWLSAPAAVLGAHLVTFLCAAISGCVADAAGWSGLPRRIGGIAAGAVCLAWWLLSVVGQMSLKQGTTFDYRVGVVQTNVPQSNKMGWRPAQKLADFRRMVELSKQVSAARPGPDVIMWPETMFPGFALNWDAVEVERANVLVWNVEDKQIPSGKLPTTQFADDLIRLQQELGVPMLIGAIGADGLRFENHDGHPVPTTDRRTNSVFVVSGGKVGARYDKVELVPFGEVIPYVWRWPSVQSWVLSLGAAGMAFDLASGTRVGGVEIPLSRSEGDPRPALVRVATPICFEVTRPSLVRRLSDLHGGGRAQLLVNPSNDGWFSGSDGGRGAHLLAARWRCVELGLPMVRSVNTGYSAAIDHTGRLVVDAPAGSTNGARVDGVVAATVKIEREPRATLYSIIGEWPSYALVGLMMIGGAALSLRRRTLSRLGA